MPCAMGRCAIRSVFDNTIIFRAVPGRGVAARPGSRDPSRLSPPHRTRLARPARPCHVAQSRLSRRDHTQSDADRPKVLTSRASPHRPRVLVRAHRFNPACYDLRATHRTPRACSMLCAITMRLHSFCSCVVCPHMAPLDLSGRAVASALRVKRDAQVPLHAPTLCDETIQQ